MKTELSIITVNYNGINDTMKLIESLQKYLTAPFELIMVDNGSEKNEASLLQIKYPFITAIRSEQNLGFAGGNNLGIERATSDFLLFINNDTFIHDGALTNLTERMKCKPNLGGISPKIVFADSTGGIQFAGYTPLSNITLRNHLIGFREKDMGQHEQIRQTPYLHGAAMLIRREAIEKAGYMPEIYFLYYEELDWSIRIREKGFDLEYNPSATVYHNESGSTGQFSPLKYYYMTRNRLLFAKRNLKGYKQFLSFVYQSIVACPIGIIRVLSKKQFAQAKAIINGYIGFFKLKQYR